MDLAIILKSLQDIGSFIKNWLNEYQQKEFSTAESIHFHELISQQHSLNNWHTESDIICMLSHFSNILDKETLHKWIKPYPELFKKNNINEPVLVKPEVNYAFAGFHEWLCCIITQTPMIIHAEVSQFQILKFLCRKISEYNNSFESLFDINNKNTLRPKRFIIYSNKNNTSVNQYFSNKKAIIIEQRPSIAILSGNETNHDFLNLGNDIFLHLGQSPRSLRKLYIPRNFSLESLIAALEPFSDIYRNNKYANNYDYHQSVFLMNKIPFLDNGFLIFKEDQANDAPTGCLFYEYYNDLSELFNNKQLKYSVENIITSIEMPVKSLKPGTSNLFKPWDYLNGTDIVQFLLNN